MPAPKDVPPLIVDRMLPRPFRVLAETTLRHKLSTPDHLLVLADGCDEAMAQACFDPSEIWAIGLLADELRLRSPDYA